MTKKTRTPMWETVLEANTPRDRSLADVGAQLKNRVSGVTVDASSITIAHGLGRFVVSINPSDDHWVMDWYVSKNAQRAADRHVIDGLKLGAPANAVVKGVLYAMDKQDEKEQRYRAVRALNRH